MGITGWMDKVKHRQTKNSPEKVFRMVYSWSQTNNKFQKALYVSDLGAYFTSKTYSPDRPLKSFNTKFTSSENSNIEAF